jgi:non-specific serine/threonine protein kinase
LTQQDLADRAGLSVHGIQKLERGATHPYRDTAQRLIAALRLEAEEEARLRSAVAPVRRHGSARDVDAKADAHHNLPSPLTSLIGREAAIRELTAKLVDTRLITLTGVGGCGKTRLAVEVARTLIDDYRDGVWLIDLAPVTDPALVAPQLAGVLDMQGASEQRLTPALANTLRNRHTLLVLDNCEHLLTACARLVNDLLHVCPNLRVLATSREPLGIGGEAAWRVPSLTVPDAISVATTEQLLRNPAVELFVQRAVAAQPRFALTLRNASAIVQICRRLDGIPLALELAAARVEALTAERIALRLDQRFRLLTGGSRVALPRQQTLAATLDWSYELLTKSEGQLFERLAVFAGGWTLEAAETVCADDDLHRDDILDLLAALTRKSLVVADETTDGAERYWMLETVRDYARQKLESGECADISRLRDRHLAFYVALIENALPDTLAPSTAETPGWDLNTLESVSAEHANIRSVLTWCVESGRLAQGIRLARRLHSFWMLRTPYAEARRWWAALLKAAEHEVQDNHGERNDVEGPDSRVTPTDRASAMSGLATFASRQGDYQEARLHSLAAADIWREIGNDLRLAVSLADAGLNTWLLGDPVQALDLLEAGHSVLERCAPSRLTSGYAAMTLRELGMVARSRGDYERAAEHFRESLNHARQSIATGGYNEARGMAGLGRALFLKGDIEEAKRLFGEALDIIQTERLGGHTLPDCLDWLAAAVDRSGWPYEAAVLFGAAATQWEASSAVRYAPERVGYAADMASVEGKLTPADFASAWAAGQAMSRQEAVDYARKQSDRSDFRAPTSASKNAPITA